MVGIYGVSVVPYSGCFLKGLISTDADLQGGWEYSWIV